jgi:hypothetical protein
VIFFYVSYRDGVSFCECEYAYVVRDLRSRNLSDRLQSVCRGIDEGICYLKFELERSIPSIRCIFSLSWLDILKIHSASSN